MKIKEITYGDRKLEWRYNPIQFSNLTLLVGISGVGKTEILESILDLRKIAEGSSLNGVEWDVIFLNEAHIECRWKGKFQNQEINNLITENEELEKNKFRIINEYLWVNEKLIFERDRTETKFKGNTLPKLSPFQSVIQMFSEEEDIAPIQAAFNKIIYEDHASSKHGFHGISYRVLLEKYDSLPKIKASNIPTQIKLALAYNYAPEIFAKIKEAFLEIFTQVEDIELKIFEGESIHLALTDYPLIYIKEKGVNNWINQARISSGMFKTLMHISDLYLCAEGSVILIDEFENSLGVNCIDVLTDLLFEDRNLQFIITSHHPYIINKIGMEYWKIVTRQGGVVTARDAKDFNLGKSRHQAFLQLINLEEYSEGIKV